MGVIVEKFHDDRGIIWPMSVAPYHTHLVGLDLQDEKVKKKAYEIYAKLKEEGIEVLFDDRAEERAGAKFSDADLIGIPVRLVVSKRTGDQVELKMRNETDSNLMSLSEVIKKVKKLINK
jgi:prolyl-tRNA synthetase